MDTVLTEIHFWYKPYRNWGKQPRETGQDTLGALRLCLRTFCFSFQRGPIAYAFIIKDNNDDYVQWAQGWARTHIYTWLLYERLERSECWKQWEQVRIHGIYLRQLESVLFLVTTQDNSGRGQTRNMTILVATRIAFLAVRRETVNSGRDLLL